MTTRRPNRPLSPLSPNLAYNTELHYDPRNKGSNGHVFAMNLGDDSFDALAELENDTQADDFDRLLLQNARDEQRMNTNNALPGKVQPFRKARTRPRVGVTLENLERHNAKSNGNSNGAQPANAQVAFQSPPSSTGSARSDPAIQPPSGWGRKAKVRRNWMRDITKDGAQTPVPQESPERFTADQPRPSIEDSPLSHKNSLIGTPAATRTHRMEDDTSFDLDNASVIASTPYFPRTMQNPALDDIRQREIDSLKEQGVMSDRLGKIRESSPEGTRRPRSSSGKSITSQTSGKLGSPERTRLRKNSWQTIGKSKPVIGEDVENTYKRSTDTNEMVNHASLPSTQSASIRPLIKRDSSQDLLRKLARVSSTPSPGRTTSRPQTAPLKQPDKEDEPLASTKQATNDQKAEDSEATPPEVQSKRPEHDQTPAPAQKQIQDAEATPKPEERTILNPKTPVVTGAWIDTPKPATALRPTERAKSRSSSPEKGKGSPSKRSPQKSPQKRSSASAENEPKQAPLEAAKPILPRSALSAFIKEARANGHQHPDDFGDSTISSLEDLVNPKNERAELDEDTLQIQLPTIAPKTAAERQRYQELQQLYRMNNQLKAARTSIRDASRGIRRVEHQVEHVERDENGQTIRVVRKTCPCAVNGGHQCVDWTIWKGIRRMFWDERLKHKRTRGLTRLSIALLSLLLWFLAENIACELFSQRLFASHYSDYGIRWNAPKYPYVIPTLFYRNFVQLWWQPFWTVVSFVYRTLGVGAAEGGVPTQTMNAEATRVASASSVMYEENVLGMSADEVVR